MKLTNYKICTSWWQQTRGLMLSRKKTVVFVFNREKYVPLHTWFVFFPITVLYLDDKKRVVEQTVITPFSFYIPTNKAKYVVEIPGKMRKEIKKIQFDG